MSCQNTFAAIGRWLLVGFAVMALGTATASAQGAGQVEGKVVAETTGEPLAGVTVLVQGTSRSAVTDAHGAFRITGVPAGQAVVITRYLGRESQQVTVAVLAGGTAQADFTLKMAALRLSDIVVSASRERERRVEIPVSIGVVDGALLRATQPAHPQEIMNRIAGVYVPVTGGEGHMMSIRQPMTTDPVYLYLEDGIPSRSTGFFNHNSLYEINVPQADRIEVSKGPATALYGSDAIGGMINVSTRAPSMTPQGSLSLDGGAYRWARMLATGSNTWGRTGLRADLNLTRTDGWRLATDYDRQSGTVRWDQGLGGSGHLKTIATFSRINQNTAGTSAISQADYLNDPTINYTPFSLRQVKAFRYSMAYELEGSSHLFSVTPYARYDWMRLIPNWSLTYDPSDYTDQNKSVGMLVKYRKDFGWMHTRVIVGTDVDYSPGGHVETALAPARDPNNHNVFISYTVGAPEYDYNVTFHGVSPYVQTEVTPTPRLHLSIGARLDETGYAYSDNLTPLATGRWRRPADTTVSYSHLSPKVGAAYEVAEALNLFAAYRNGFRAPSQGQLFRQGSAVNTVGLQPVKVNSYEGGIRGRIAKRVDYDVTAYSMIKTDDILSYTYPDGHTEAQNAGRTTHRGIETSLGIQFVPALRLDVAYSYAKHVYADWKTTASVDLSGKEIVSAPRNIANVTLTLAPPRLNGAQFAVEGEQLGSYWEDQADTHQYPGHTLINLRASSPPARGFVVSVRLMNLTNERYSELTSYTVAQGEQFAPGLPRRLYVTMQYNRSSDRLEDR